MTFFMMSALATSSGPPPDAGLIALEFSAFTVDGRPDLGVVIYNPATPADTDKIRALVKAHTSKSR